MSKPSIEISSGGRASPGPVTLICRSTVSPTVASELLKTAVTLGESALAIRAIASTANNASKIRRFMRCPSTTNLVPTNRYRHDALLCVHQVGLGPLRLSSIQAAPTPGVHSFRLLSPVQPRQPFAHFYRAASVTYLRQRL